MNDEPNRKNYFIIFFKFVVALFYLYILCHSFLVAPYGRKCGLLVLKQKGYFYRLLINIITSPFQFSKPKICHSFKISIDNKNMKDTILFITIFFLSKRLTQMSREISYSVIYFWIFKVSIQNDFFWFSFYCFKMLLVDFNGIYSYGCTGHVIC